MAQSTAAQEPPSDGTESATPFRSRTLLVGTANACGHLGRSLVQADATAQIVGCVVPNTDGEPDLPRHVEGAGPVLGCFAALSRVLRRYRTDRVLVSVPVVMAELLRHMAATLDGSGVFWLFMPTMADQLAGRVRPPILLRDRPRLNWPRSRPVPARHGRADAPARQRGLPGSGHPMAIMTPAPALGRAQAPGPPGPLGDPVQLIGRRPPTLDEDEIRRILTDRVVLITGAGGSIGSELARQVGLFRPARIVLVERAENALFEIDRLMQRLYPDLERAVVLHDVTNAPRTAAVVAAEKPHLIFHAAAHKHVPMMEDHPSEAVENNFYGTRSVADAAALNAVDRFVMISTDKAVNPCSVMGATKRLAELYIQHLNLRSDTIFSMVRFGNVLGSACSVLPIWSNQITQGLPVTVTHPRMMRYFMTIPEAAGLVIQAAAFAGKISTADGPAAQASGSGGGEVFVLDMGEPVSVYNLAKRFIRNQGLEPDLDVPIEITGIRPGEKLIEELAYSSEEMVPTPHPSICRWQTSPPSPQRMDWILRSLDGLRGIGSEGGHPWQGASHDQILAGLHHAVPEMTTPAAPAA